MVEMSKLGRIFQKPLLREVSGRSAAWDGAWPDASAVLAHGIVSGTQVATATGWRGVEAIQEGDRVLTFDAGLQTVRKVTRNWTFLEAHSVEAAHWPLTVSVGVLGNKAALTLLPEQAVMIESDLGEEMFGDPFTLLPAHTLGGLEGITREMPEGPCEVIQLQFEDDQVIFANIGALFHCPANTVARMSDLMVASEASGYDVLPLARAREFVDAVADEAKFACG